MTQVSEDAAFVRYPPPALSQRASGFQPLLLVKVAGPRCEALSKSLQKSGICGCALSKSWQSGELKGFILWVATGHPTLIVTNPNTLKPQNRDGEEFSLNLLTFSNTELEAQSINFSRSPEDQYGSL